MAQQTINIGSVADDGTGDTLRAALDKVNDNFNEFYGGTSFPGSPSSGDRYYRTDRNIEYVYDGTRWLSTQLFSISINFKDPVDVDEVWYAAVPFPGVYSIWLDSWEVSRHRSAAGEWDMIFGYSNSAFSLTPVSTIDGSGDAGATWLMSRASIGALLSADARALYVYADEVSGTAIFYIGANVHYRLVG